MLNHAKHMQNYQKVQNGREHKEGIPQRSPIKRSDLGSFFIPCLLESFYHYDALCDLGASCNIMSYFVFTRLRLRELKPTKYNLQFANRSLE